VLFQIFENGRHPFKDETGSATDMILFDKTPSNAKEVILDLLNASPGVRKCVQDANQVRELLMATTNKQQQ
jgi:hypothetical protein